MLADLPREYHTLHSAARELARDPQEGPRIPLYLKRCLDQTRAPGDLEDDWACGEEAAIGLLRNWQAGAVVDTEGFDRVTMNRLFRRYKAERESAQDPMQVLLLHLEEIGETLTRWYMNRAQASLMRERRERLPLPETRQKECSEMIALDRMMVQCYLSRPYRHAFEEGFYITLLANMVQEIG